jgi:hypothetical protein
MPFGGLIRQTTLDDVVFEAIVCSGCLCSKFGVSRREGAVLIEYDP